MNMLKLVYGRNEIHHLSDTPLIKYLEYLCVFIYLPVIIETNVAFVCVIFYFWGSP